MITLETATAETPAAIDVENEGQLATWAIVEIMGHRRLIGYLTEQEIGGHPMLRIDILSKQPATQYYGGSAVYCITPVTEETARRAAGLNQVAPVKLWELPEGPDVATGQYDGEPPY
jgi:hypothetical protein